MPGHLNHARRALWLTFGVIGALLAGYLVYRIVRPTGSYSSLVDGWGVDAIELVASAMCLARGFGPRSGRRAAVVIGVSLLAWSLGDVALTVESLGGAKPPSPSVADAFYLCFFPIAYVGIVLFMRGEVRRLSTPSWLDGAVAGLGAASVCAAFAFHTILRSTGENELATSVNLAYPMGDLLLFGLVAGASALLSGRRKAPWCLLAVGIGLNVFGDTFNLFQSSIGASHFGATVTGIAWPASILLMSMAVWLRPGAADPLAHQRPPGFLMPGLAAASGLVVLLVGTLEHMNAAAVGLATATLILVGVRLALSVRGMRAITLQRHRQAVTDHLTGLGNRRRLFEVLDAYFAEHAGGPAVERPLAFLFIDLNGFKEINDSFGHPAGDEVLKQLGARLAGSLRASDVFVRIGGDEFAAVLIDADAEHAMATARHLSASLEEPCVLDAVRAQVGASIGIALAPVHATDRAGLVRSADVAMYRAKLAGSPFILYEQDLEDDNRLRLAEELRVAIETDQLVLHYQPQLDLRTGEISNFEALVRWPHPSLGLIPPLKFLPLAEEAGLMGALTRSVLTHALAQCASWRAVGRRMTVSVNVSASNLLDAGFTTLIWNLLERHQLPAEALVVEITETSVIREFERSRKVIEELRHLGVVASVDDFGAGFTSLAYLSSLAVGELKLDRTFITGLATGDRECNPALVRATVELGHSLGLRVVAEGVEDRATLDLLSDLGCDLAQGFFIDLPKPADELAFALDLREAAPLVA
jgi:diguanylate cyclase (GGDEF)-like protein